MWPIHFYCVVHPYNMFLIHCWYWNDRAKRIQMLRIRTRRTPHSERCADGVHLARPRNDVSGCSGVGRGLTSESKRARPYSLAATNRGCHCARVRHQSETIALISASMGRMWTVGSVGSWIGYRLQPAIYAIHARTHTRSHWPCHV